MPPLVSIVLPCYKGARYLREAVESCLAQTYAHFELLIVDDASPDDCFPIAKAYAASDRRVRVMRHQTNCGVSRAWNTGYTAARGTYFTRLAQDDRFREDALERMVTELEANPSAGLVYCDMQIIDEEGRVTGEYLTADPPQALEHEDRIGLCVMWRREAADVIGPFDPDFDAAEDYEYWLRLSRKFPIVRCRGAAPFFYRVHGEQGTNRFAARQLLAAARARCRHVLPAESHRETMLQAHRAALWGFRSAGDWVSAWRSASECVRLEPTRPANWRSAVGTGARLLAGRLNRRPNNQSGASR